MTRFWADISPADVQSLANYYKRTKDAAMVKHILVDEYGKEYEWWSAQEHPPYDIEKVASRWHGVTLIRKNNTKEKNKHGTV